MSKRPVPTLMEVVCMGIRNHVAALRAKQRRDDETKRKVGAHILEQKALILEWKQLNKDLRATAHTDEYIEALKRVPEAVERLKVWLDKEAAWLESKGQ